MDMEEEFFALVENSTQIRHEEEISENPLQQQLATPPISFSPTLCATISAIIFKHILYMQQQTPSLLQELEKGIENLPNSQHKDIFAERKTQKFVQEVNNQCAHLQALFAASDQDHPPAVAVTLGGTVIRPKRVFIIHFADTSHIAQCSPDVTISVTEGMESGEIVRRVMAGVVASGLDMHDSIGEPCKSRLMAWVHRSQNIGKNFKPKPQFSLKKATGTVTHIRIDFGESWAWGEGTEGVWVVGDAVQGLVPPRDGH